MLIKETSIVCNNINLEILLFFFGMHTFIFSMEKKISNLKKSTRNTLPAKISVIGNNDILIVLFCLIIPFLLKREIIFCSEDSLNTL